MLGYVSVEVGRFMVPKKVFMIGWEYPPHNSGGLGVACEGMTQALADQGQHIYFTLPYHLQHKVGHMQVIDCYDPAWFKSGSANLGPPHGGYLSTQEVMKADSSLDAAELSALPQSELEQRVNEYAHLVSTAGTKRKGEVDVIHAHDWMSFPAAAQLKKQTGLPVVAHIHSTEYDRIPNGHGSPFIHHTEKQGLEIADKVIAVSKFTKQLIVRHYGIDPAKISVVYNGIDPLPSQVKSGVTSSFAHGRPVIVFMGRLTMQKGAEYFLQIAQQVLQKVPEALFIIGGDGDQYHSLLLSGARQQLSAHLLFAGFVRDRQKEILLNRADVFVMPSLSEPFGLVALEAAQRDTPVIVSSNSGVAEVLTGALVVDFWDVQKTAQQVLDVLTNKQFGRQVVAQQHESLQEITWHNSAKQLRSVYRQLFVGRRK